MVSRDPPEPVEDEVVELALREAFDRVRRQVQEFVHRRAGRARQHVAGRT